MNFLHYLRKCWKIIQTSCIFFVLSLDNDIGHFFPIAIFNSNVLFFGVILFLAWSAIRLIVDLVSFASIKFDGYQYFYLDLVMWLPHITNDEHIMVYYPSFMHIAFIENGIKLLQ